jgi:hypothetical protein
MGEVVSDPEGEDQESPLVPETVQGREVMR